MSVSHLLNQAQELLWETQRRASCLSSLEELDVLRVDITGKNGRFTALMKGMGSLAPEDRRTAGEQLNVMRESVHRILHDAKVSFEQAALEERLSVERIDMSLPARSSFAGKIHPISRTIEDIVTIFTEQGFSVAEGHHIETDWYNFTALNIPDHHPARQDHDTFYFPSLEDQADSYVLRTHTSPVQIRSMEQHPPPLRLIVPGCTYRSDSDSTHTPMFHQVEGLVIDKHIHWGHLKWILTHFCSVFFGLDSVPMRFRSSYFPFTEPSAEVDIAYTKKNDKLILGEKDKWLEILGCGMVHPAVIANCGLDPEEYQGFAFGMGIERVAMLKYGITDLRQFFEGDKRWLDCYGFSAFDVPSLVRYLS